MKGKELKVMRTRLGWTQVEMAMALRVTANTVARWEREERAISDPIGKLIETVYASEKKRVHK